MRTQLVRAVLLTAGGVLLLAGWVVLGRQAAYRLQQSDRAYPTFADIDCPVPAGLSRADFLGEVQYLANLPDRLPLDDDRLAGRLAAAFAAHPLVESADHVEVLPRRVRVSLHFRYPVLAIPGTEGLRVVDRAGVLLPQSASAEGLPRWAGAALTPPPGTVGTVWNDDRVRSAARLAAFLLSTENPPIVEQISAADGELMLFIGARRFRWGSAPGAEQPGEADAAGKLARLRELATKPGTATDEPSDLSRRQQ